ncbi:hypothetical protein [Dethiosulfatarculus sandiegensis]|uniref:hypothetical protein n=1 Tax=Dethiosulfatarculus sandiegensis TaxID=1429043 RepID=UPI0012E1E2CD|nr:hypothetical protein [Dethiosulfatarculus sandiegensis]
MISKRLGKIDGVGHCITGDRSGKRRKSGWEYPHVCVDDNSRTACTEVLPDEKATSAICFLIRAAAWFQRHGVAISRLMADIDWCSLTCSRQLWTTSRPSM